LLYASKLRRPKPYIPIETDWIQPHFDEGIIPLDVDMGRLSSIAGIEE
jgi:hypothetical protein